MQDRKFGRNEYGLAKYLRQQVWSGQIFAKQWPNIYEIKIGIMLNIVGLVPNMCDNHQSMLIVTNLWPSVTKLCDNKHYRTFKAYYTEYVQRHLRSEFPKLLSYQRFVELMPTVLVPLIAYLHTQLGRCGGISFIDSTSLAVCHNGPILLKLPRTAK